MKTRTTPRGFRVIEHEDYPDGKTNRLLQESSAVGHYDDAFDNPGSSYLWVDEHYHLNREEIAEMINAMQYWLDNKRLPEKPEDCKKDSDIIILSKDEAISLLPYEDYIHTFRQAGLTLIGADWDRELMLEAIGEYEVHVSGDKAQSTSHGIAFKDPYGWVFVETREDIEDIEAFINNLRSTHYISE